MNIRVATTDAEIAACYPVMRELRSHIAEDQFLSRIRNQEVVGYRLAYVQGQNGVVAVAGFRVGENLAWGRFLYVDDLVTLSAHRSKSYGSRVMVPGCFLGSENRLEGKVASKCIWILGFKEKRRTDSTSVKV